MWPTLEDVAFNFGRPLNKSLSFAYRTIYDEIELPWILRVADMDYDGYPDLVTVVYDDNTKRYMAAILANVERNGQRVFELTWLSVERPIEQVLMVSLFDPYNVGRLSLLITYKQSDVRSSIIKTLVVDYYAEILNRDYYNFLKVHVVGGLCSEHYDHQCPNDQKSAVSTNPATVMVCYAGIGHNRGCAPQMPQSAHFALHLPYVVFGLGKEISEMNEIEVSLANRAVRQWDEMIPGSTLVVSTYTPDNAEKWQVSVYLDMSINGLISMVAITIFIAVLSFAIYILHIMERHEDRKDVKLFQSQYLNFKNNRPR